MNTPAESSGAAPHGESRERRPNFRQQQQSIAVAAQAVGEQLSEPNVAAIGRLMEIFGQDLVRQIATDARRRFDEARAQGPDAYQPQPNGSAVALHTGAPRTCGGVFFFLIRTHINTLGLNWFGLRIPSQPLAPPAAPAAPKAQPPPIIQDTAVAPALPPRATPAPAPPTAVQAQGASKPAPASDAATPKPSRLKATVVGTPNGTPRPSDQPGVLQLAFDVEMSPTMPKGLPTLGRSRVVVLCTEKQYRHAVPAGATPGRMIVEGEIAPTLSAAGKPLLVLVCTRITTPEIEQARHDRANG